jgi:SAM-dependent methyltransferase
MNEIDYKAIVKAEVFEEESFLRLTLSKPLGEVGSEAPVQKIGVRPVAVRGERALQFSYFDETKDITKNYTGDEAVKKLDEALAMPFGQLLVQAVSGDLQVLVSQKGNASIARSKPSRPDDTPVLSHDRDKGHPLPANSRDPLLKKLRIINKSGKVGAAMRGKFTQINEFLRVVDQVLGDEPTAPLNIVDCGCGGAYLTFAAYRYLNELREIPASVVGIDTNAELIAKCTELGSTLHYKNIAFRESSIADYTPDERPNLVLSLHACDTATDEAIAQGVKWKAAAILAAPCCQHELHGKLKNEALRAVLRQGILRERTADIVTDAFRALALRIMGYRTMVAEFVSPESTSKNLMIRAEWGVKPGQPGTVGEYKDLKAFWNVTPAIERMLGDPFRRHLRS